MSFVQAGLAFVPSRLREKFSDLVAQQKIFLLPWCSFTASLNLHWKEMKKLYRNAPLTKKRHLHKTNMVTGLFVCITAHFPGPPSTSLFIAYSSPPLWPAPSAHFHSGFCIFPKVYFLSGERKNNKIVWRF